MYVHIHMPMHGSIASIQIHADNCQFALFPSSLYISKRENIYRLKKLEKYFFRILITFMILYK